MKGLKKTRQAVLALTGCFFVIFLACFFGTAAGAQESPQSFPSKVAVLVIIDRLNIADFTDPTLATFRKLNQVGAWGLMNTTTASSRVPANTYVTIGAGVRGNGSEGGGLAFNSTEQYEHSPAGETFRRRTGLPLQKGQVGHLGLAQILRSNEYLHWTVRPGALGASLGQGGLKTAVLGNADNHVEFRRQAVTVAMDDQGIVDLGDVSERLLRKDPTSLVGKRTDYDKLFQQFTQLRREADFIVIELGDSARVDDGAPYALDQVVAAQRLRALQDADRFLARVMDELDLSRDLLMVVTPTPPSWAFEEKELLTPVIMAGGGISPGLVTSGTTKRRGIVANTDIAPTVLSYFGLEAPPEMTGRPMSTIAQDDPMGFLARENRDIVFTYQARPILVQGYVILQIVLILLSILTIFFHKPEARVMKPLLLGMAAVPLTLLLLPLLPQTWIPLSVLEALALTVLLAWVSSWLGRGRVLGPFIWICLATTGFLFVDLLLGAPLIKASTLGYDPIIGARYYGIGNEYMGVYIGAAIIGLAALLTVWPARGRRGPLLAGLVFLVITYTIAAPHLGTNVGGTISAVVAFGLTFYLLQGHKVTRRAVILGLLAVVLAVGAFIIFDLSRGAASQSHIGRTAMAIKEGGIGVITDIAARKLAVNLKLIRYTRWSWVFLLSMGALAILFYRPVGILRTLQKKYPQLFKGFIGVVVGSITALIFNDSGIVAAATMMIFAVATLLYLVMEEGSKNIKKFYVNIE